MLPRSPYLLAACCAAALATAPSLAHAKGTALFSWNVPASPTVCSPNVGDLPIAPGAAVSMGVVALGLASPYHGYDVAIDLAPLFLGAVPDAWRFDADGCQANALGGPFYGPFPIETGCSDITRGRPSVTTAFTRTHEPAATRLRLAFSVRWPDPVTDANPLASYLMVVFDLGFTNTVVGPAPAGVCGGVETPMCLRLARARMVRPDDTTWDLFPAPPAISANAAQEGGPFACGDLPARAPTWGAIKAQYR